ncbi:MAG: LLM class flavin-dependent oxidoreductase [Acidimicrobiales bacterium]
MKLRIAVAPGGGPWSADAYVSLVDGLEERGFDTIWLSDVPLAPAIDPTVGLAFAAARTSRLKLGANVVPIGRHPMLLAKELAQIDQLSDGRLLLMIVPGIGHRAERQALGVLDADRGAYLDEVLPLLRGFWSGEPVDHHSERFSFTGITVSPRPVQDPLELWLGGMGPRALERAGRLADGWLGAALTPSEAGAARGRIQSAATAAGRTIDPEHFGLSIPYARTAPSQESLAQLAQRRPDADPTSLLPVGREGLRALIGALADEGLSKFVLRPAGPMGDVGEELDWLAGAVLDLQT